MYLGSLEAEDNTDCKAELIGISDWATTVAARAAVRRLLNIV